MVTVLFVLRVVVLVLRFVSCDDVLGVQVAFVLFITSEGWAKVDSVVLYYTGLWYDPIAGCEINKKQSQVGILPGKLLLQSPVDSSPHRGRANPNPHPMEKNSNPFLQEAGNPKTRTRGALSPARWRRGIVRSVGLCGSDGLAQQTRSSVRL